MMATSPEVGTFLGPRQRRKRVPGGPLVHVSLDDGCPACGGPLVEDRSHQGALVRDGGYGATERTVAVSCARCSWSMTREVSEVRPDRA